MTAAATVAAHAESWPIARPFRIARGAKTVADVVVATVRSGGIAGRGECVAYRRYGERAEGVVEAIRGYRGPLDRAALRDVLPPGAARNALDCALWDLEAKRANKPAWQLAGLPRPTGVATAYTIGLDTPGAMGERAAAESHRPLLKLKLGGAEIDGDLERLRAVRRNAPGARLIVDANEGWEMAALERFVPVAVDANVRLIEQPLPEAADAALADARLPIPIAADESARGDVNMAEIATRYQVVNIKLDKTGGLTQALALAREARALGLGVMVGCMVCTSLAVAPALLLAHFAEVVDLDGPLLLARDRTPRLPYENQCVSFDSAVWG